MKTANIINRLKTFLIKDFNFREWTTFQKYWLVIFTLINLYLFFAWRDSVIGLVTSLSGMLCVILTAKGRVSSFYWGIINILTYSYVAFRSAYYGDVMLNMLYFLPMSFIGIYYWNKNLKKSEKVEKLIVRSLGWKKKLLWLIVSVGVAYFYGLFLSTIRGTLPFVDAMTTVFSVVAMILLTKRFTDQWFYWILVDVLAITMWVHIFLRDGNDINVLVMWVAFLVNAIYGYYHWMKLEKNNR